MSAKTTTASALTWVELAERLGFTARAMRDWRKRPDAPQEADVEAWTVFIAENDLGVVGNRTSKDREELLKEKLTKENRLLDLKIAREEKTSVDRAEVDALLLHIATMQKTVLYPALERELPAKAEGRTAAEISLIGREIGDRLCAIFTSSIESWQQRP